MVEIRQLTKAERIAILALIERVRAAQRELNELLTEIGLDPQINWAIDDKTNIATAQSNHVHPVPTPVSANRAARRRTK